MDSKGYRRITSLTEKKTLLGDRMVRFQPGLGVSTVGWMERLVHCLIDLPTAWFEVNTRLKEDYADKYTSLYGEWLHSAGTTVPHNLLGMAYAWWVRHVAKNLTELTLSDSPDLIGSIPSNFHGDVEQSTVRGDIGTCSPVAMYQALRGMLIHDVWISVLDWHKQIFIQFGYSPGRLFGFNRWVGSPFLGNPLEAIRDVFYCPSCGEWSITEEYRQELVEWALNAESSCDEEVAISQ